MYYIALKMLFGDPAKYLGLVFGILMATLLMAQQVSIFVGLMGRTASQILDVREADIWVMDPQVRYIEEFEPLPDTALWRVRGVDGVAWATPFYKGLGVVNTFGGHSKQVILLGVDDTTLIPYPLRMVHGRWEDLKNPQAMVMDQAGWRLIFKDKPFVPNTSIEINEQRVIVTGLCDVSPTFVTFPMVFSRYSQALRLAPQKRHSLSYVLVRADDTVDPTRLARTITEETGLQALTTHEFQWRSINYYLANTGIPINFGITVTLGFLVGALITGQTFYLFVLENLRQFGMLKAIGVTNAQIVSMVLLQAAVVAFTGFSLGIGLAALFFKSTADLPALRGFFLYWQIAAGAGVAVILIMTLASIGSLRKVLTLDPAVVFR